LRMAVLFRNLFWDWVQTNTKETFVAFGGARQLVEKIARCHDPSAFLARLFVVTTLVV